MKKILITFIGIITLLTVGCKRGSIEEITFDDYTRMVENEETFILFIGSSTCSRCAEFKITVEEVINNYDVHFKYLDIANLGDDQRESFVGDIRFEGTPTTVFIEAGVDNSCNLFNCDGSKRIEGALTYEETVQILKNKGYIEG